MPSPCPLPILVISMCDRGPQYRPVVTLSSASRFNTGRPFHLDEVVTSTSRERLALWRVYLRLISSQSSSLPNPLICPALTMAKLLTSLVAPFSTVVSSVVSDWNTKSTFRTRLVDALCLYSAATALVQLVYVVLVGTTFPFNSFL